MIPNKFKLGQRVRTKDKKHPVIPTGTVGSVRAIRGTDVCPKWLCYEVEFPALQGWFAFDEDDLEEVAE